MSFARPLRPLLTTAGSLLLLTGAFDAHAGARIMKRLRPAERAEAGRAQPAAPVQPSAPVQAPSASQPVDAGVVPADPTLQTRASDPPLADPSSMQRDEGAALPPNDADTTEPLDPGVDLTASTGIVHRSLRFYQDVYDRLRALNANLYVYRLDASVYPVFRAGALDGHVALVARFEAAYAGSVRDEDFGGQYPIAYSELFAGLRVRRLVQRQVLGFELGVGRLAAGLDDGASSAGTPDVRYGNVRAALDLGTRLGPVRATFAAAFRVPLSYGQLADDEWFPRVGGYGIEAQASAAYPLSSLLALEASASLRRFVLEMNSEPEDGGSGISEVAGGAVDSFLALYAGIRVSL